MQVTKLQLKEIIRVQWHGGKLLFLLCSYHLAFKSSLVEDGRRRVKGNYVRCRDNERSILREETRMFVYRENEAFQVIENFI